MEGTILGEDSDVVGAAPRTCIKARTRNKRKKIRIDGYLA